MRRDGSLLVAALAAAIAAAPAPAWAQAPEPPPEVLSGARKAYDEGTAAEKAGDCATAIARFEAAAAVKETPAVRLRIGRCREKLGALRAALADYERARDLAEKDPQAREVAEKLLLELAPRVPRLELQLESPPPGLVIEIDGRAVPPDAPWVQVDPGSHVVAARAPGSEPFEARVELREGESRAVAVTLRPASAPTPPPREPAPPPEEGGGTPWLPIGLYVGGGVAVGVGLPLLLGSLSADADIDARCFDASGAPSADRDPCLGPDGAAYSPAEQQSIADDRSAVNTQQVVGWVLIGAGAAAAGVATVLLLVGDDASPAARGPRVAPVAGPGVGGVVVGGAL